jgi:SAM-dependent methyltransferase
MDGTTGDRGTTVIECVVCGEERCEEFYPSLDIVKCPCGHVYYPGKETDREIQEIYDEGYFKGRVYFDYENEKKSIQRNFRDRLKVVRRFVRQGKLLEVGSAYGFFLDLARDYFDVLGFELCSKAAAYGRDVLHLDVRDTDFLEENLDTGTFDVGCMYDCIEHLRSPQHFLKKIASILKPGGYLFLTTGDIKSPLARIQGRSWRLIEPPIHIHYFSKQSIKRLLENYGFEVVKIVYPGTWRSNSQIVFGLFKNQRIARYARGSFWINTFDIMEVAAKKIA